MSLKVLVVDDEPAIVTLITYNLEQAGYDTIEANNGRDAVEIAQKNQIDFILMDIMLSELDGLDALKQIRKFDEYVPIVMITAKSSEIDKIMGLELGADDYLTKPFSPHELISRMKAILRRTSRNSEQATDLKSANHNVQMGTIEFNFTRHHVTKDGQQVDLTPNEFKLFKYLYENANQVLSRDQILNAVWGFEYAGQTRIVDIHISHLRDKLEIDSKQPQLIKTVRGFGYEFNKK
ncbi:response regulator transcription factor [Pediococcus argentinicus]|uniref:response regulator transcription factor n=1 Tax=Pediococcus argentinicus TaxID=480391 RepID=UPI00338E114A